MIVPAERADFALRVAFQSCCPCVRFPARLTVPLIALSITRPENACLRGVPFTSALKLKLISSPRSLASCSAALRPPTVAP